MKEIKTDENRIYYSVTELSQRFGVSTRTIWRWIKDNDLPEPIKLAHKVTRWLREDIHRWESIKKS